MKLNLGCGKNKLDGYINIDKSAEVEPDLCHDITVGLPFETSEIDEVRAFDILEHIPPGKVIHVINEIWRVLKPGGLFEHFTPSTDGRGAWQDPTHVSFWNYNSWFYYTNKNFLQYGIKALFKTDELHDVITDTIFNVIHTHGRMRAVKERA